LARNRCDYQKTLRNRTSCWRNWNSLKPISLRCRVETNLEFRWADSLSSMYRDEASLNALDVNIIVLVIKSITDLLRDHCSFKKHRPSNSALPLLVVILWSGENHQVASCANSMNNLNPIHQCNQ
jgi:hypothetical protein